MKIKSIKVNSFGKLNNKDINLSDKLNIIYGKNEAGKSTLLKFIQNIFYGTSKNKKGKSYSDYELYKPWNTEDFSGKIKYILDNGEEYEVYREFGKKNPKIFNGNMEDISKNYNIDKNTGSQFFYEQTKVDEFMFLSSIVSMQQEVRLNKQDQNVFVQKIANLAGTGDDSISYKKAIEKLNKKQLDEIGTDRSQGKPINICSNNIKRYKEKIQELEQYKQIKDGLDTEIKRLKTEIDSEKLKEKYLKELKDIKEQEKIEEEKIKLNYKIKEKNNDEIKEKNNELNELLIEESRLKRQKDNSNLNHGDNEKKVNIIPYICCIFVFLILCAITYIITHNIVFSLLFVIPIILTIVFYLYQSSKLREDTKRRVEKINKEKNELEYKINNEIRAKIDSVKNSIELIQKNNDTQDEEINKINNIINYELETRKVQIKNKYTDKIDEDDLNTLFKCIDYNQVIENINEQIRAKELKLNTLEINKENAEKNVEELINLEEDLSIEQERMRELSKKNEKINLARQYLQVAYEKMKNSVAPKFTSNLSQNINKISAGKYNKVTVNDEEGLIVELPSGEYVPAEKLSGGTIEQLYLSLRLSMAKEISDENMPIILDEAFAYYDDQRLENTLKFLLDNFEDNQIILFTCTDREKDILNHIGQEFNYISIE